MEFPIIIKELVHSILKHIMVVFKTLKANHNDISVLLTMFKRPSDKMFIFKRNVDLEHAGNHIIYSCLFLL